MTMYSRVINFCIREDGAYAEMTLSRPVNEGGLAVI